MKVVMALLHIGSKLDEKSNFGISFKLSYADCLAKEIFNY